MVVRRKQSSSSHCQTQRRKQEPKKISDSPGRKPSLWTFLHPSLFRDDRLVLEAPRIRSNNFLIDYETVNLKPVVLVINIIKTKQPTLRGKTE